MAQPAPTPRRPILPGAVARITDLDQTPPDFEPLGREEWGVGDYVVAEVLDSGELPCRVETTTGRIARIAPGDLTVGALGSRAATLEAVGDWRDVGEDGVMQQLSAAGVFGRCTSLSRWTHELAELRYRGHAMRGGHNLTMRQFVDAPEREFSAPMVMIVGTSMDAGKTVAGKEIIRALKRRGLRVAGAKLTGVGRYQDTLGFSDSGADFIADFIDAGLPSTVLPAEDYEVALRDVLAIIAAAEPDVVVAEAGASPLEPYNGDTAMRVLAPRIAMLVVCASDPYAVVGVVDAFDRQPDLVSGRAASTDAAIALVEKLTGLLTLNVLEPSSRESLDRLLAERLGLSTSLGPSSSADGDPHAELRPLGGSLRCCELLSGTLRSAQIICGSLSLGPQLIPRARARDQSLLDRARPLECRTSDLDFSSVMQRG